MGKGALADIHPQQLGATVLAAIRDRNDLDTAAVDDVIFGTSMQVGTQGGDLARMALLDAGFDTKASGVTLDRFCGSGITTTNFAAASIMSGLEDVVIAGGCEMMSLHPALGAAQAGVRGPLMDAGNERLRARHPQTHQGVAADAIATLEGIPREALDELALVSQQRAARAIAEGRFDQSLVPVLPRGRHARPRPRGVPPPEHHARGPGQAGPVVRRDGRRAARRAGHHAALDGAGPLPGPEDRVRPPRRQQLGRRRRRGGDPAGQPRGRRRPTAGRPRARIVAAVNMGDDPTLMLNAPVPAARKVLDRAGLTVDDIDLFEINEAFAVVAEKFIRDLDLDREKVNVNGGAMALGHPIAATGAMLIGTVLDELERTDGRYGLVTMCAAGGMAPAIIIERL